MGSFELYGEEIKELDLDSRLCVPGRQTQLVLQNSNINISRYLWKIYYFQDLKNFACINIFNFVTKFQ